MEVRPLYSLYLITHTGHFTAVQGARPIHDTQLLEQLVAIVESIRPGRGKYYELHIARVTEDWQPTDTDFAESKRLQRSL